MAFVSGYEHDIFVSYAHVDDEPLPGIGVEEGWVTTLVKGLKTKLAQRLKDGDPYSLWMDHELSRHVQITPEIANTLQKTATLLVILSSSYLASNWCKREKDTFYSTLIEKVRPGSRVFIVERNKVELSERPQEYRDIIGYQFWIADREGKSPRTLGEPMPDPRERAYYDQVPDLSFDLAMELKRLKEIAEKNIREDKPPIIGTKAPDTRPAVFLAQVTDDLEDKDLRNDVKRYLDQAGFRILPETYYPNEPTAFGQTVDSDLGKCILFVQLLSNLIGKKPGFPQGYPRFQYQRAVASGKPILQWRNRDLDTSSIADSEYKAFLEGEKVLAIGIEEFKSEVVKCVHNLLEPDTPPGDTLVFVNAEKDDFPLAESVGKVLDGYRIGYAFPLSCISPPEKCTPSQIREDLEQNLLGCSALILIYGNATPVWVREQFNYYRRILPKRNQPLPFALCEGPPPDNPTEPKPQLGFKMPGMRILQCRGGANRQELQAFLQDLEGRRNS